MERALCLGVAAEIAGEGGLGWSRRLMMIHGMHTPGLPEAVTRIRDRLGSRYGYAKEAAEAAPGRCADILQGLTVRLRDQKATGSPCFVGERLSVADLTLAPSPTSSSPFRPT